MFRITAAVSMALLSSTCCLAQMQLAEGQKLEWQVQEAEQRSLGGGLYSASERAVLVGVGKDPTIILGSVSANVDKVKADEAEKMLRPQIEKMIQNYAKQVGESGQRIVSPSRR